MALASIWPQRGAEAPVTELIRLQIAALSESFRIDPIDGFAQ
jgi:hypothetical protein